MLQKGLGPFNHLADTSLGHTIGIWPVWSRRVVCEAHIERSTNEFRCTVGVKPLDGCTAEKLVQGLLVVIGGFGGLRKAADVLGTAVIHDSRETLPVQAPTFVGVCKQSVCAYFRAKFGGWRRQLAAAWPPLHLDFGAGVAKTILATVGHHVPQTCSLGTQLGLLFLELPQIAWIGTLRVNVTTGLALGFSLGLYWPWPFYCRRKRCRGRDVMDNPTTAA